jgi:stage V sporulation protein R
MTLLFEGAEWDFATLDATFRACEEIAVGELGLTPYPSQVEVITSEQMLDAYSSIGLPLMYRHWSFGKRFARDELLYRAGMQNLAYEIVINSNPCIAYLMEENSMTMQALVIAHACFGHNHFFRTNHLFRQWTDADGILDYLAFARRFVAECEERHGLVAVERILDAAHSLQGQGVHRYLRRKWRLADEETRARERQKYEEETFNPLWTTVPGSDRPAPSPLALNEARAALNLPEENLLYLCEKHSPRLRGWERELVRIVRVLAQYFYPQMQTKLANEGCATAVHYAIMTRLHDRGQIGDGAYLEFLASHTAVTRQPTFAEPGFHGWNPYALGFAIMRDIERACTEPDDEDRRWFPGFAGNGDPWGTLRDAWAEYRDESLIRQFLGPKVMRAFRMVNLNDKATDPSLVVTEIHDDSGFRRIRSLLADQYEPARAGPLIEATDVDLAGDRNLKLTYLSRRKQRLHDASARQTLAHLQVLWGYKVTLQETDAETGRVLGELRAEG